MDLNQLRTVSTALDADLKDTFLRHGFKWAGRKATLGVEGNTVVYRIDLNIVQGDGSTVDTDALRWKQYANIYNLPIDGVGKTFSFNGRQYTITGWRKGRSAKLVLASRDGKTFVFQPDTVRALLEA